MFEPKEKMSIKTDLIGKQYVKGNIRDSLQVYKIYYYPPEEGYPTSKVWLYFNREQKDKILGTKSLCFESVENHRNFILNNIIYNLYWLEKKSESYIPTILEIGTFRMRLLDNVLNDLRKKVIKRWEEQYIKR